MYFQLLDTADDNLLSVDNVSEQLSLAQRWLQHLYEWCLEHLPSFIAACTIFLIGWWVTKLICKIFVKAIKKSKADLTVISFLNSIINVALKIIVIILVLSTLGFDVTTLIAAISAAAVTIGLALKDSLADIASGTLIIINKKFKTGDYLETEGLQGKVEKIEMMYTTLRTYDNKKIMIPNSRLASNNITNYFVLEHRRIDITVPVSYHTDIDKARKVIFEIMNKNPKVLHEMNNKVAVNEFGESSINLMVWVWCQADNYWVLKDEMYESIKNQFDKHGIEIPFNQLDVHLSKSQPPTTK